LQVCALREILMHEIELKKEQLVNLIKLCKSGESRIRVNQYMIEAETEEGLYIIKL